MRCYERCMRMVNRAFGPEHRRTAQDLVLFDIVADTFGFTTDVHPNYSRKFHSYFTENTFPHLYKKKSVIFFFRMYQYLLCT